MDRFVCVIYIGATAEGIWQALTVGELTHQFWSDHRAPGWKVGSRRDV